MLQELESRRHAFAVLEGPMCIDLAYGLFVRAVCELKNILISRPIFNKKSMTFRISGHHTYMVSPSINLLHDDIERSDEPKTHDIALGPCAYDGASRKAATSVPKLPIDVVLVIVQKIELKNIADGEEVLSQTMPIFGVCLTGSQKWSA